MLVLEVEVEVEVEVGVEVALEPSAPSQDPSIVTQMPGLELEKQWRLVEQVLPPVRRLETEPEVLDTCSVPTRPLPLTEGLAVLLTTEGDLPRPLALGVEAAVADADVDGDADADSDGDGTGAAVAVVAVAAGMSDMICGTGAEAFGSGP